MLNGGIRIALRPLDAEVIEAYQSPCGRAWPTECMLILRGGPSGEFIEYLSVDHPEQLVPGRKYQLYVEETAE